MSEWILVLQSDGKAGKLDPKRGRKDRKDWPQSVYFLNHQVIRQTVAFP